MLALVARWIPGIMYSTGRRYTRDDPRTVSWFAACVVVTGLAVLAYYLWQAIAGHSKDWVEREDEFVFHVHAFERRLQLVITCAMFAGTMAFCVALFADFKPWTVHLVFTAWPIFGLVLSATMIVSVNDRVTVESGRRIVCRSMLGSHRFQIPLDEILAFAVRERPAVRGEVGDQYRVVAVRRGSTTEVTLSLQGSNRLRARALSQRLQSYLP